MRGNFTKVILGLIVLFVLIQLVPYGRNHTNPPVQAEPQWDSPETRALVKRACFDCHSNETVWPWYANIAPFSWVVQRDVDEGRGKLNFSEWNRPQEADEVIEVIRKGKMPPKMYLLAHPQARLTQAEKERLIRGLQASLGVKEGTEDSDD